MPGGGVLLLVFRGMLAMAHPPALRSDFEETGGEDGPVEEEMLPRAGHKESPDFIHFDLDPLNSKTALDPPPFSSFDELLSMSSWLVN